MEKLGFRFFVGGFFILCIGLVVLGFFTLRSSSLMAGKKKAPEVTVDTTGEEITDDQIVGASGLSDDDITEVITPETESVVSETPPPVETKPETENSEHATLIAQLEKLIDDVVYMKVGSRGTRVGTVQEFLNIYLEKQVKVDNDYGAGTKTRVAEFQKGEGITSDGEAGPKTYQAMIDWLNEQ